MSRFGNEIRTDLLLIKKNENDTIKIVSITDGESNKLTSVDIRQFYKADDEENLIPTKKGVRIPADQIENLIEALTQLLNN